MQSAATDKPTPAKFLVIGATGTQGGAVARQLLAHNHRVRILTRHPESSAARRLMEAGAEAVNGDLGDPFSLESALFGIDGIFSMSPLDGRGPDAEKLYASVLVKAAVKAGVGQFVHASVAGIERIPNPDAPQSLVDYWNDKWEIEELVRNAGFASWTILRPTWVMENLAQPAAQFMFPELRRGEIHTALKAGTRLDMVAADDVGAFACAALEDPVRFNSKNIDLAGDSITMNEAAIYLSHALGKTIKSVSLLPSEALAQGLHPSVVNSQEYRNRVGFQVDIEKLKQYGIPLTTFESWVRGNKNLKVLVP